MENEFKNWKRYLSLHKVAGKVELFQPQFYSICVVIPCYNEPKLFDTINSIWNTQNPGIKVAVIVVVNSGENSPEEVITQNKHTYSQLLEFSNTRKSSFLTLIPLFFDGIRHKHAGVGYARKLGMDYATWLFYGCKNINGIIVSLDADCTVEPNYFIELTNLYQNNSIGFATHYIEHPLGSELHKEWIIQYELYLRYFKLALWYCGFPYAIQTVGSAFSVKADVYVKYGGMNRKKGGEDFYFLHKIAPHETMEVMKETTVNPSSRISVRVPFGTGPALKQMMQTGNEYQVYSMESFLDLRKLFIKVEQFFDEDEVAIITFIKALSPSLQAFLSKVNFTEWILEAKANASTKQAFQKRMFSNFNAFKTVQFLNESHSGIYQKKGISTEASHLLKLMKIPGIPTTNLALLQVYRELDKGSKSPTINL